MKRYKPLVDKLYFLIAIPSLIISAAMTVLSAFSWVSLLITVPVDLLIIYFLISPLFGYAELREDSLYIKFGLILKREIPYKSIRGAVKCRAPYSEAMLSLKCAMLHVNVKHGVYDVVSVGVQEPDLFISELEKRVALCDTGAASGGNSSR